MLSPIHAHYLISLMFIANRLRHQIQSYFIFYYSFLNMSMNSSVPLNPTAWLKMAYLTGPAIGKYFVIISRPG